MNIDWFEKKFDITYSEMECNMALKPYFLLSYLQDLATDNADFWNIGYDAIHPQNLMWVLIKYRMEFDDYPIDVSSLTVKTMPRGYYKMFAYRDFEICNDDKRFAKVSSIWSLVNISDRTIAPIEGAFNSPCMTPYQKKEGDLSFEKIRVLENFDKSKEFEVRYNEIDVNRHANNCYYIVWALEVLDLDFRVSHKLKTLDMMFKKEICYGEKLTSNVYFKDDNTTVHVLRNSETGEDLCLLSCKWCEV